LVSSFVLSQKEIFGKICAWWLMCFPNVFSIVNLLIATAVWTRRLNGRRRVGCGIGNIFSGVPQKQIFEIFQKYIFLTSWPTDFDIGSSNEMGLPSKQMCLVAAIPTASLCLCSVRPWSNHLQQKSLRVSRQVPQLVDAQVKCPSEELVR
jgi:hypothetical protein